MIGMKSMVTKKTGVMMNKVWIVYEFVDGDQNTLDVYASEKSARERCEELAEYIDFQEETNSDGSPAGVWSDSMGTATIWYEEREVNE